MSRDDTNKKPAARPRLALTRLITPILLVLVAYGVVVYTDARQQASGTPVGNIAESLLFFSAAFLLIRLIDVLVWRHLMGSRGRHMPRLLRDVIGILIFIATGGVVISHVYGQSLTGLMAASTVSLGVLGLALQRPILDAFSGIVLTVQQPFKVGDWIELEKVGVMARVTEINWRVVHMVTVNEVTIIVPNGQFIQEHAKIYSQPDKFFRDEIKITLPYNVTTHQGQRILLGAVNQIEEIAALPRTSSVTISDYNSSGIEWRILYWCPDPGRITSFQFQIHQNLLRNLHYAGIEIPMPMLVLHRGPKSSDPMEDIRGIDPLIHRVSLFATLTAEELRHLTTQARNRLVHAGTALIRQGDAGDSLFILREGLLEVRKSFDGGPETVLDNIHPGQSFGEMSLLLGDPRSATIAAKVDTMVVEITKEAMTHLMQERPELVRYLADLLAQRQSNTAAKQSAHHQALAQGHTLLDHLTSRITHFFGLAKAHAAKVTHSH